MPIQSFSQLISDGTSPQAADLYREEGMIYVQQLLTAPEIAELRKEFTDHVESHEDLTWTVNGQVADANIPAGDILKRYPRYPMPHRHEDMAPGRLARKWITDPRIYDIVENLIGNTWAAQSMFYFKPPTARGQALHQDNFYLQSHPETCLAAWIAVDDADAENGALQVVPGSHVYDITCPDEADPAVSFSTHEVKIPPNLKKVQSQMKAGDVLFFHGGLIHGSMPNNSANRFRRSLIFHYIPEGSVQVAKFYQPLLTRDGTVVSTGESVMGGECGSAWESGAA